MKLKIYGSSDDLIEIEGDIREEFNHYDSSEDKPSWLVFSDGTVLKIYYNSEGIWKTEIKCRGRSTFYNKTECTCADGQEYSDIVTLTGEFSWVWHTSDANFIPIKSKKE